MEEHTLKLTNVHTQFLLQMQNEMNLQMMNERFLASQNELETSKTALGKKENELKETKSILVEKKNKLRECKLQLGNTKTSLSAIQNELKATKTTLETNQVELHSTKETLRSTHEQLHATKITLVETQTKLQATLFELDATKVKLEASEQNYLKLANDDEAVKNGKQIGFFQDNIKEKIEQVQKQNVIGLSLIQQITETVATCWSGKNTDFNSFLKHLEVRIDPVIEPIEPIDTDGMKLEFPKLNLLVKSINGTNYFDELLMKMKNGNVCNIDSNQVIFKLHLPKNHREYFIYHHSKNASFAKKYTNILILHNDHFLVLDIKTNSSSTYQIYLQIPNYDNANSKAYIYPKNETGNKLLLENGANKDINIDSFRNAGNEVLFQITKNI